MPEDPAMNPASTLWSMESLKTLGLPTILCCLMLWIGKGEVEKASERLDKLFDWCMKTQVDLSNRQIDIQKAQLEESQKSRAALENNTEVIKTLRSDRVNADKTMASKGTP